MIVFIFVALGLTIYNSGDKPPQKTSNEIYRERSMNDYKR